jgi:transcriptional regulator with XRE-family HTH domain
VGSTTSGDMATKNSLSEAIKSVRKARGLSQEAFSDVSSRTYLSSLERGLKSPTWQKLTQLCEVMDIHPLTLLTLAYGGKTPTVTEKLFARIQRELDALFE